MNTPMSILPSRTLAAFLVVALICGPLSPTFVHAEDTATPDDRTSIEERLEDRAADTTPPTIDPHDDVGAEASSGNGALVSYTLPATFDDVDGAGMASCVPPPDSLFAIGTTTVICTAIDAAGNSATPVIFDVVVNALPEPETPTTDSTDSPQEDPEQISSEETDPPIDTGTGTTTPEVSDTTSTTGDTSGDPTPETTPEPESDPSPEDPTASSSSTANSGEVAPEESDTDNTDFENITDGAPPPDEGDIRPVVDASATSTEALASEPFFAVASATDGTGHKIGGTIFTGDAVASTTVKNTLNISKSNVDGPGVTNGSIITSDVDNEATLTTTDSTQAETGENTALGGEGLASIRTGNAVSTAQVLNVVNTNLFNSEGLVLFLNPLNGDGFDLRDTDLSYFFDEGAGTSPTEYGCTILTCLNSSALSILNRNTATVDNDVSVRAATGGNIATSTKIGGADIETGDAYAAADVLNLVNTNFINSSYLIASFNNFGDMNDDIVLPDASFFERLLAEGGSLPELQSSSYIVNNTNDENFFGTTTASALTGDNTATTTGIGHGEVFTGNAYTSSNSYTAANQTRVGGASVLMVFRVWGEWSGTIQGLPEGMTWRETEYGIEILSTGSGSSGGSVGVYNSSAFVASSTNSATVHTDVEVLAETGGNRAETVDGTAVITTGDAYAAANVVNLINTNIVGRNWVFATFNIFGSWSGDIAFGGHSPDLGIDTTVEAPDPIPPNSDVTYHFSVTNDGDVSADNVTLSATYDTDLLLFTRGNTPSSNTDAGTTWNLGTLAAGESKEIIMTARVLVRSLPTGFSVSIPLTATVTSSQRDQNDVDNESETFITVSATGSTGDEGSEGDQGSGDEGDGGGSEDSGSGDGDGDGGSGSDTGDGSGGGSSGGDSTGGGSSGGDGGGGGNSGGNTGGNSSGGSSSGGNSSGGSGGGSSGGGGGGAISAGSSGSGSYTGISGLPDIRVKKTSSVASTTAPVTIDYKIVVTNSKSAGRVFKGVLTDTLRNPSGTVMYSRSWDLETVFEGDEITLTYSAEFGANMVSGLYKNVARVTGITGNPNSVAARAMTPVEAVHTVQILPNGMVLGAATSTVAVKGESLKVLSGAGCAPLITGYLRRGGTNNSAEVRKLQMFLTEHGFGSFTPTGFFGPLTTAAVNAFQLKYASEILTPLGLSRPTGGVYASTQRKINILACGGVSLSALDVQGGGGAASYGGLLSNQPLAPTTPKKPASQTVTNPAPEAKKNTSGWLKTLLPSLSW